MCDSGLPKYSSKLRETFHQINPYHISCTYKALFDDHALDILRSLSDVEDASNVCLLDPPQLRISPKKPNKPHIRRYTCNSINCGGEDSESPEPRVGICSNGSVYGDEVASSSHGMYYKPNCQLLLTMFLRTSSIKTSHDTLTLRVSSQSFSLLCFKYGVVIITAHQLICKTYVEEILLQISSSSNV